jgi:isopenicillin-N epimerase
MALDRRQFLHSAVAAAAAAATPAATGEAIAQQHQPGTTAPLEDWPAVRAEFALAPGLIHMSAMLLASNPRVVRDAITAHRRGLDLNPVDYVEHNDDRLTEDVRKEAGAYLGIEPRDVALTGNTTEGVGLVYNGLMLRPGQEILTTRQDYYVTYEATRLAAERTGAIVRHIDLYDDLATISPAALADTIVNAVRSTTRVVALTWVHSSTGLKIPVQLIAERLAAINERRAEGHEILLAIDGVHGFGVEDVSFPELGADFLMAGCHKWLFGPRGTGLIAASERGWDAIRATIPTFTDGDVFGAWLSGKKPDGTYDGTTNSPGGFHAFEHRWALAEAFRFHARIGRKRIADRVHDLAGIAKAGLAGMKHVTLVTPQSPELSAGIVSFNIEGYSAVEAVAALRSRNVIASAAPYATRYVRLTPSILNSEAEVQAALATVRELA